MNLEKRLLDHVLCRGGPACQARRELIQFRRMPPYEQFKGRSISVEELSQELLIRWRNHGLIVSLRPQVGMVRWKLSDHYPLREGTTPGFREGP